MSRNSTTTITIDIHPEHAEQIAALHSQVPLATRHAVARAALALGLQALTQQPSTLADWILTARRRHAGASAG